MVYKLSATLSGHSQDVRCVASSSSSSSSGARILSSSRDKTARSWKLDAAGGRQAWIQDAVYAGHDNFVGAVTAATLSDGTELAVTGSNDATICVSSLASFAGLSLRFLSSNGDSYVSLLLHVLP
jgi:phospholipase A-2-activating protein